ncbi:MAG: protein O-mannosyl-transferase family [Bacteroidota bacterium]
MFTDHKSRNRLFAGFVFLAALILYTITLAPTASFWDAGEFIAVANGLQVTHPPGAPFYLLIGRFFSMFMPPLYVALSVNFVSALASALTVMFLYLIIVRLVREWKGHPDEYPKIDLVGMYGGAIIGALTFAVTDSFWFSAVESEVYALSMFFTSIVAWLAFKWSEHADDPGNERWLILIAYMFGLATGVHLLNLLVLFFVALIIYFRTRKVQLLSLVITGVIAIVSFFAIYPFTIITLPDLMDDITHATYGLVGPVIYIAIIGLTLAAGIYYTHTRNKRTANMVLIMYAMILIGYSSYALVFIRSMADPPIDENDPETVDDFVKYLKREQYGQTPLLSGYTYNNEKETIDRSSEKLFPRRHSGNERHLQKYAQYESDWDFFWNYQINHMYFRYFNWNFIGRDADIQDAGWNAGFRESDHEDNPAHNNYYFLPFLLGLFGLIFHFQRDWKRALSVFVLFFMTGLAIVIYLNQTPFQPRERDYAYVGSFFAFSIWIGLGATGIIELIKDYLNRNLIASYASLGVLFLAIPVLMLSENFHDHDRSERYVAPDYAFNLLNSCAPNAILFTNGDNDTFPLWYLQEVEGVRTDVRIVCLSLLNTDWYIKQLKNQWSHESAPLPISLTDDEIENLEDKFRFRNPDDFWTPKTVTVPVNKATLKNALASKQNYLEAIGAADTSLAIPYEGVDYAMPVDSMDNQISYRVEGTFLGQDRDGSKLYYTRIQDDLIMDLIKTNQWVRPIYFATTVSRSSQLNLQPYFRLEGQAFRLVPKEHPGEDFGWIDTDIYTKRLRTFRYRELDNPDAYFDENIRRMIDSYRFGFTQLSDRFKELGQPDSALKYLTWGQEKVPFTTVQGDLNSQVTYAYRYADLEAYDQAVELAELAKQEMLKELVAKMDDYDRLQDELVAMDDRIQDARKNADMTAGRQIQADMQSLLSRRENMMRDISYNSSRLMVIQRIYFMAGNTEQAKALADTANSLTHNRIGFPTTREENKKQVDQFYRLD